MLFRYAALALAVVQSVSGFAPNPAVKATRIPTAVSATREKELVPPGPLEEITKEVGKTQSMYDFVQKTYG